MVRIGSIPRGKKRSNPKKFLYSKLLRIFRKYQEQNFKEAKEVFPVISNQKTNKYLKGIITSIGIRKKITL